MSGGKVGKCSDQKKSETTIAKSLAMRRGDSATGSRQVVNAGSQGALKVASLTNIVENSIARLQACSWLTAADSEVRRTTPQCDGSGGDSEAKAAGQL